MLNRHVYELINALPSLPIDRFGRWGATLATTLAGGGRLLAAGNGGSAAQAQHLTAELVGRYAADRQPLSAVALHADTSALTAIGNDFGFADVFARQVQAHGRRGDVLIALSTSGSSANLVSAAQVARGIGMTTWALCGPLPNPLAAECDDVASCPASQPATVQECHLVAVHLICAALDEALMCATVPATVPSDHGRVQAPAAAGSCADLPVAP